MVSGNEVATEVGDDSIDGADPDGSGMSDRGRPGAADRLMWISRGFHEALAEKKVPHVWHVHTDGGHDFAVWKADLYHFVPLLFR